MSAVPPTPRVKLRSTSRRIPRQRAGGGVMEADPEPEMRLSRALLVMLLMHIVVIGGIVAFSLIKERNPAPAASPSPVEAEDSQVAAAAGAAPAHPADAGTLRPNIHVVRPAGAAADALELIEGPGANGGSTVTVGDTARTGHLPADSGKTYIVGKGETPISIAHKLKVSYDALLKLNGIDDPKKLKPGQKLRVPVSTKLVAKH